MIIFKAHEGKRAYYGRMSMLSIANEMQSNEIQNLDQFNLFPSFSSVSKLLSQKNRPSNVSSIVVVPRCLCIYFQEECSHCEENQFHCGHMQITLQDWLFVR